MLRKNKEKVKKFRPRPKPCMMLGYVHKTTKIWRIWDFDGGSHGQGRAMECPNTIFEEEINAYERFISSKTMDGQVIE
jgi:hypothetical protein